MANTSAIQQQAAHTTYHLLATHQEPYKKASLLTKNISRISGKTSREWTIGSKMTRREEIRKEHHITALRFQTGMGKGIRYSGIPPGTTLSKTLTNNTTASPTTNSRRFPEITSKDNLTVFSYSGRVKSPEWRQQLRKPICEF